MQSFFKISIQLLIIYQNFLLINGRWWSPFTFFGYTKEPCKDFYKYACKNYKRDNPNEMYSEITQKLDYEMNLLLLQRMEYLMKKQENNESIFIYMESCKNEKRRNLRKYFEDLKPAEGLNWPIWEEKEEQEEKGKEWLVEKEKLDLWSLLGEIQSYGLNNLIVKHNIIRNDNDELEIRLQPADILQEEKGTLPDKTVLEVLLEGLGIKDVKKSIKELQETDLEWQNIIKSYTNSSVNRELFPKDLTWLYPKINLTSYLTQLLSTKELENISSITIESPEYFEYLNNKTYSKEDLQNLCNYLMIKFLYYLADDGVAEFTSLECIKDMKNKLELAVNLFYYNHFFRHWSENYLKPFENIFNITKITLNKIFLENHLNLTAQQLTYLSDKLDNIKINIGNLPLNFNNKTREEFYQDLPQLSKDNYYKNHLLLLKYRFTKSLENQKNKTYYLSPTNRMGSMSSPFYLVQKNMVIIPFEILQQSFFSKNQTPLQKLTNFGFVLVHELAHAFDTTGLQFDKNGLFLTHTSGIMDNDNFQKSLNCMQEQQPTDNIDERIADLLAVRVVYRVYKEHYNKCQEKWNKNFFENLAQFFCGKDDLEFFDHDSDPVRLQQIVKNFQPFSEAYGCNVGNPMNPRKKCRLY